jgi:hypothetical protein
MRLGRTLFVGTVLASALLLPEDAGAASWTVPGHFTTIQAAIDSYIVKDGDTIEVLSTVHLGATVTKAVRIHGVGTVVINDGPLVTGSIKAGFLFPGNGAGSGATITNLQSRPWLPVPAAGRRRLHHRQHDVTPQNVSSWQGCGQGWVSRTSRTGPADGAAAAPHPDRRLQGRNRDRQRSRHNEIRGRVRSRLTTAAATTPVPSPTSASRRPGAVITTNRVLKNWVQISSSNSALVTVSGIELSDTRDDPALLVIQANSVIYNHLYRMTVRVSFHPDNLPTVNRVERNYGKVPGPFLNGLFSLGAPDASGPSPIR